MDLFLALAVVALAAAYLVWRAVRTFRAPEEGACGGCSENADAESTVVEVELELPK